MMKPRYIPTLFRVLAALALHQHQAWAQAEVTSRLHAEADSLEQQGAYRVALALTRQALSHSPNDAHLLYDVGRLLLRSGFPDSAVVALEQSILVDSTSATAWSDYGASLAMLDRLPEARESFRAAYALDRSDALIVINLARTEMALGEPARGLDLVRTFRWDAADPSATFRAAELLLEGGHYSAALALYALLSTRLPQLAHGHLRRGDVLIRLGRFTEAIDALELVTQLRPDLPEGWGALGYALYSAGQSDAARVSWTTAVRLDANYFSVRHPEWQSHWEVVKE